MKISYAAIPLLAMVGGVIARDCTPGLDYCEQTLLDIGDYQGQIGQALANVVGSNDGEPLFRCTGGADGFIKYKRTCKQGCQDAGAHNSDFCITRD